MLDVSDMTDVREGMVVTVFGRDGGASLPVEEFAALSGTINYESICLIGQAGSPDISERRPYGRQLNYIVPED